MKKRSLFHLVLLLAGVLLVQDSRAQEDLNLPEGAIARLDHTGAVISVSYSLDGQTLASGDDNATVRLWDVATGELLLAASEDTVVTLQHPATSQSIATVNRGSVAFAGGGPSVPSPRVMATADGDTAWVSPDSSVVATVSRGTVLLWDRVP